jgi:Tfp pilus assembly pilus retraction ATPase PilT
MIATPAIRNLIREDKIAHMYSVIQTNHGLGYADVESGSEGRPLLQKERSAKKRRVERRRIRTIFKTQVG